MIEDRTILMRRSAYYRAIKDGKIYNIVFTSNSTGSGHTITDEFGNSVSDETLRRDLIRRTINAEFQK